MYKPLLASLVLASTLSAQGGTPFTITSTCNGNMVFERTSYPTSPTSTAGFANLRCAGTAGTDSLYQSRWYYRLPNDPGQSVFNNGPTSGLQAPVLSGKGDTALLNWRNTDGRGFDAQLQQRVYSTGGNTGVLSEALTIRNALSSPLVISIYHYADYDVVGAGGDSATLVGPPQQMEVSDSAAPEKRYYLACGATSYEVTAFAALRNSLGGGVYNLSNTGIPFGPGDFTGGYEWMDVTIPANGERSFYIGHGCDFQLPCCDVATIQNYCVAKPGTNGIPRWGDNPLYVSGQSELKVLNGLPGSAPVVYIGARNCISLRPFGDLAVFPLIADFGMPAFDPNGTSSLCLTVPSDPLLCGAPIYMQSWFLDPGAQGFPVAHTDGGCFTIGSL